MKNMRKAFSVLTIGLALLLCSGICMAQSSSSASSSSAGKSTSGKSSTLLDINSATKDQLATLPGIGDTYSQKIIDGRPYHAKTDLVKRKVIPQATYDQISTMIIARRAKSEAQSRDKNPRPQSAKKQAASDVK